MFCVKGLTAPYRSYVCAQKDKPNANGTAKMMVRMSMKVM
ncbi:hypothetical protein [Vibrio phage vB_VhaP_PG11]|nr:hypothetical protein [Vibrio phage vB_VhaP_PG11]